MTKILTGVAALLAAAAIGGLGASALAGGNGGELRIKSSRDLGRLAVEPAERPAAVPRASGGSQKLKFFQTPDPIAIDPQTEQGATLSCPKGHKALNAYFFTGRTGTFLDLSAPEVSAPPPDDGSGSKPSKRNWVIGVLNATAEADQVVLGVVCLNKVK